MAYTVAHRVSSPHSMTRCCGVSPSQSGRNTAGLDLLVMPASFSATTVTSSKPASSSRKALAMPMAPPPTTTTAGRFGMPQAALLDSVLPAANDEYWLQSHWVGVGAVPRTREGARLELELASASEARGHCCVGAVVWCRARDISYPRTKV